jgi:hypothetical protein
MTGLSVRHDLWPISISTERTRVRRQLFLRIDDNYFSLSGWLTKKCYRTGRCRWCSGAERCCDVRRGDSLAAVGFWFSEISTRGGGKVGNLLLVFHFSIRPRRRSCGNGEISKGLVERVGSLPLALHVFRSPGISTAHSGWIDFRNHNFHGPADVLSEDLPELLKQRCPLLQLGRILPKRPVWSADAACSVGAPCGGDKALLTGRV